MIKLINFFIIFITLFSVAPLPTVHLESFDEVLENNYDMSNRDNYNESEINILNDTIKLLNEAFGNFEIDFENALNITNEDKLVVMNNIYEKNDNQSDGYKTYNIYNQSIVNLNGDIIDTIYYYDNTNEFTAIKDVITGANLFYANATFIGTNGEYENVKIYDAKRNEIKPIKVLTETATKITKDLPLYSIGKYLIYAILDNEKKNNGKNNHELWAYDTSTGNIRPIIHNFHINSDYTNGIHRLVKYKNKKIYFIEDDSFTLEEDNINNTVTTRNVSFTYICDESLSKLKYLPYAYDDTFYIDGEEYLLMHKKKNGNNSMNPRDSVNVYNLIKIDEDKDLYTINMGEYVTYIDIYNVENNECKITKNGINYIYNIKNNTLVQNLDNKNDLIYNALDKDDTLYNYHTFDDGIILEIKNNNNYRLVNEKNIDMGIYSDKPILQGYKSKKTKYSMLIREKITDENNQNRYLVRTLSNKKFKGLYEDEFVDYGYYKIDDIWDNKNTSAIGFNMIDESVVILDLVNGTTYRDKENKIEIVFPIGNELYFYNTDSDNVKLYNLKNPDTPALTLDYKYDKDYYYFEIYDDIFVMHNTVDDNTENNVSYFINKNLKVIKKNTLNKCEIKEYNIDGKNFYAVNCNNYNRTVSTFELYDDNFNLIIDNIDKINEIKTDNKKYLNIKTHQEAITLDNDGKVLKRLNGFYYYYKLSNISEENYYYVFKKITDDYLYFFDNNLKYLHCKNQSRHIDIYNEYFIENEDDSFIITCYDKNFEMIKEIDLKGLYDDNYKIESVVTEDYYSYLIVVDFYDYASHEFKSVYIDKNLNWHMYDLIKYCDGLYLCKNKIDNEDKYEIIILDENMNVLKKY